MKKTRGVFEREPGTGVWWIQYFDSAGRRRREKVGRKSAAIELAEKRRTETREHIKLPTNFRKRPLTVAEMIPAALSYSAGTSGHKANVSRAKTLVEEFGNAIAEELMPGEIMDRLNQCKQQRGWTLATRNRHIALLKLIFRLAEEKKDIHYNPARVLRQEKENNARIRFLSDSEETRLRAVIPVEHLVEFDLAVHTGMRKSEQYGMTWDMVDLNNRIVTVPRSKSGETRHVNLNSRALTILSALKAGAGTDSGPVLPQHDPRYWFESALRTARINNFTWHCLRHTFVSRLTMAGVDLRTVQELAGHKTIQMTTRYSHLAPSHLDAAVERLVEQPTATSSATGENRDAKTSSTLVQ